jgi:phospholipase C
LTDIAPVVILIQESRSFDHYFGSDRGVRGFSDRSYALADTFTICDNYCCPVMGPTDPNRLRTMVASLDPDGKNGGPSLQSIVTNRRAVCGRLTYTAMPEQLQARGISWKVYSLPDETVLGGIVLSQRTRHCGRRRFCLLAKLE